MEVAKKVSVILPVYNCEKLLPECIESLQKQTLADCEFLFVDDESTDSSVDIIQEYAKEDERIVLLQQKHQNAGAARNLGMAHATGKYYLFLDSDDFFDPSLLEKVYNRAEETEADMVLFDAQRYDNRTGEYLESKYYLQKDYLTDLEVFSRKDLPEKIMLVSTPCPWTKFFRASFVKKSGLQFQLLSNTNDAYFTLMSLCLAEKIAHVDEVLVNYRIGIKSTQGTDQKDPACCFEAVRAIYRELNRRGIFSEVEVSFVNCALSMLAYDVRTAKDEEKVKELANDFLQEVDLGHYEPEVYTNKENYGLVVGLLNRYQWEKKHSVKPDKTSFKVLIDHRKVSDPEFSVIVPVYNTENYLEECVNSVLNQSCSDLEVICINDGSPDRSLEVLEELAGKDERVVVCTQKNQGLSATRNNGVTAARGKYILFLDSDDLLAENALTLLQKKAEENDLDVLFFDGRSFIDGEANEEEMDEEQLSYIHYYERSQEYSDVQNGIELMKGMRDNGDYKPSACLQIVKRDHFLRNGLWFYEGIIHEDNLYTFASLLNAGKAGHIGDQLYLRRLRADSIVMQNKTFNNVFGYFVSFIEGNNRLSAAEKDLTTEEIRAARNVLAGMLRNARNIYRSLSAPERMIRFELSESEREYFSLFVTDATDSKGDLLSKLQQARKEKSEINAKLQRTYKEKSEINAKLQQTYKEKSEINAKLKRTYEEKSEINAKLKQAYADKTERGKRIKELEKELKEKNRSILSRIFKR